MGHEDIWMRRFIGLCDHIADWSEDKDFQVGCVIVDPEGHQVRTTGYNGLPRGVSAQDDTRFDRSVARSSFGLNMRNATQSTTRRGQAYLL